jgi:IPT/TIG domain
MSDTLYGFDVDVGGAPLWTRDLAALVGATPVPIAKFAISGATVSFGGSAATSVVVVNARKITARTPPHKKGPVNVVVTDHPDAHSSTLSGDLHTTTNTDSLCCGWHCGCYPHCGGCILR